MERADRIDQLFAQIRQDEQNDETLEDDENSLKD